MNCLIQKETHFLAKKKWIKYSHQSGPSEEEQIIYSRLSMTDKNYSRMAVHLRFAV